MERSINTYSAFNTGPAPFFDGRVDNLDAHFSQLRLWRDLNQDGISQGDELFTLGQEGIAVLLVAKKENAVVLNNGNQLAAEQLALIDGLVQAWAATSSMPSRSGEQLWWKAEWTYGWNPGLQSYGWSFTTASAFDPTLNQKTLATLQVVEAFNGSQFPGSAFYTGQLKLLDQSQAAIDASVYDGLVLQTRLKPYLDAISLDIGANGISLNYAGMITLLDAKKAGDVPTAVFDLVDLYNYAGGQLTGWNGAEAWTADAGSGSAVMSALAAMGFVTPSGIWGRGSGNDSVLGSTGADQLSGNVDNDILMGKVGNNRSRYWQATGITCANGGWRLVA